MLCIGHRGAKGHAPENTLLSIQKAISLGAHWIEIDVYAVENELIVIHDNRLERTTNGIGYTTEQKLSYLRSLDAGQGEQLPTLREVFDMVNKAVGINVEIKGFHTAEKLVQLIEEYICQGWTYEDILISSFNHYELIKVKEMCPDIQIGALVYGLPLGYPEFAKKINANFLIISIDFFSKKFVRDAHAIDLKVLVYTVNSPEDFEKVRVCNVDGIITDYPEMMLMGLSTALH